MPPGVEHWLLSWLYFRTLELITVSMPPGVEHADTGGTATTIVD